MTTIAEAPPFTAEDFRRRALVDRGPHEDFDYGDHRFNPGHPRVTGLQKNLRDAAVLIPVVDHGAEASVILTRRAETLASHAGQVAFPGGRIDATDATPEAAALREAEEEIGLDPRHVEVIARMPDYKAGNGYRIVPVLGIVKPGFTLTPNPGEVDVIFEVPLRFLMDPVNHARESREFNNHLWTYYDMAYGKQRIWGVTAGIIRTLYERLYQ